MLRIYACVVALVQVLNCAISNPARATTFVRMDEPTLLRSSVAVVVGTVTGIESAVAEPDGPIYTYVTVQVDRVIKGALGTGPLVLRESGGTFGGRREWTFGAPEFWVGERSLLFLSRNADGSLRTNNLSMGKYTLGVDATGHTTATRDFGDGVSVILPGSGQVVESRRETQLYLPLVGRLRKLAGSEQRSATQPFALSPPEIGGASMEVQEAFTYLGSPSRWFEPDSGQPVTYLIDSTGDRTIGFTASRAAIDWAFAAWTSVPTASIVLTDGGTTLPSAFAGCGTNRIVFNDPYSEVPDPSGCTGTLAQGGFCSSYETKVINGTTFERITTGKLTFNNGWGTCSVWNQINLAEVATHEIGHTIGLGHSTDPTATMAAIAHFDGRCAGPITQPSPCLGSDDVAGVTFMYPQIGTAAPTVTPTLTRIPTATAARTPTRTPSNTPSPTPLSTQTPTATQAPTQTPTAAQMPTQTPTWTSTATVMPSITAPSPTPLGGGALEVATDLVFIARRLLGLPPVPTSFRLAGAPLPDDAVVAAWVDSFGQKLDVDMDGTVNVATDITYAARDLLGLTPVPPSFRTQNVNVPPDAMIAARIALL